MKMLKKIVLYSGVLFVGLNMGIAIERSNNKNKTKYCGVLRIDNSESDEDSRLFLELEVPLDSLEKTNSAIFKVVKKNYISHN